MDVNPVTNKIYVTNAKSNNVTVIDGATNATATVNVGTNPIAAAVNPVTNQVYVANHDDNTVTVIDGSTNTTTTVSAGTGPTGLAVNPVTNKIYVANAGSNNVTVIDGATTTTTTVSAGSFPRAVAVNPVTNKIYVVNFNSANVTVINGADNTATTVSAGVNPFTVAVDPVTNQIYVANFGDGSVTRIDGATDNPTLLPGGWGDPYAVAVNPVTSKVYVSNFSGNNVTVIDGATNTTTTVNAGPLPNPLAVNLVTNKIYVVNTGSTMPDSAMAVTNGPVTGTGSVTVITEQQVQPIPLTIAITPLPGNQVVNPSGAIFNFNATSSYMPIAPPVLNVYFQFDTWQGRWLRAIGCSLQAGVCSSNVSSLLPGIHIVYAYATDGQFADSIQTGPQSSPIIGAIAAYVFVVAPTISTTTVSLTSGSNPSTSGQSLTFTATIGPGGLGSVPRSGTVQFRDEGSNLGLPVTVSNNGATLTTAALSVGAHKITAVYSGDDNFSPSVSQAITQAVMATSGAGTSTSLTATPNSFFRRPAFFQIVVSGTSSGTAILLDGDKQIGPLLTVSPIANIGTAAFYSTPLSIGVHHIRAVFLGTTGLAPTTGSLSNSVDVNASPRPKPR